MSAGWWLLVWALVMVVFVRDWHEWMGSFDDE